MKTEQILIPCMMIVSITWILSVTNCEKERIHANEHVYRLSTGMAVPQWQENEMNKEFKEEKKP